MRMARNSREEEKKGDVQGMLKRKRINGNGFHLSNPS